MTENHCPDCKGWKPIPGTSYISNSTMCDCSPADSKRELERKMKIVFDSQNMAETIEKLQSQLEEQKKLIAEFVEYFLWVVAHECDGAKGGGCGICMPCQARKLKAEKSL